VLVEDVVEVKGDALDNVLGEDDIDNVVDEELEEVEPNVGYNFLDDNIDNDMTGNDNIDDDVDMAKRMIQMLSWMKKNINDI